MSATGAMLMSLPRIRMRSARLPTVIEPVTSPRPSALAPFSVAISITSRKATSGSFSVGVPRQGMPMVQVKRMVSNMLGGAIELASNDSEISTLCRAHAKQRVARVAGAAEPELRVGREAERRRGARHRCASASLAGMIVADQELRAEPAALLVVLGDQRGWAATGRRGSRPSVRAKRAVPSPGGRRLPRSARAPRRLTP